MMIIIIVMLNYFIKWKKERKYSKEIKEINSKKVREIINFHIFICFSLLILLNYFSKYSKREKEVLNKF